MISSPRTFELLRRPLAFAAVAALAVAPLHAAGWLLFQHGGRSAAQAGALVARADEPSAVRQNPAALVDLDGLQMQAGLDFNVSDVGYRSAATGSVRGEHEIQFPPELYLSWKRRPDARWAVGVGIDSPMWMLAQWPLTIAPGRSALESRVALFELRPALAWRFDARWSVGAALRYVRGTREHSLLGDAILDPAAPAGFVVPLVTDAKTTIDGTGWALAARYAADGWGAGAQWSSHVALSGNGRLQYDSLTFPASDIVDFAVRFPALPIRMRFELPDELAAGVWREVAPGTRVELDADFQRWSAVGDPGVDGPAGPLSDFASPRDWRDVWGLRAGAEHRFASGWRAAAGLAIQPSPVPDRTREFGFPYGDTRVVSLGGGYDLGWISFDGGWSYHQSPEASSGGPAVTADPASSFRGHAQVFSLSVRWRFADRP
jgi:long-chain fatty acid transport protein